MTPQQKHLVQTTFQQIIPAADAAADLFYQRLFALDPDLRPLFPGDLHARGRRLMQLLTLAVEGLDHLGRLLPTMQDLGREYAAQGIEGAHYDTIGAGLLWMLTQSIGSNFTADARDAWASAYRVVATTMKEAPKLKFETADAEGKIGSSSHNNRQSQEAS